VTLVAIFAAVIIIDILVMVALGVALGVWTR
jgi:hypothetical protein